MRIVLDVMGGDFAPQATLEGALLAVKEMPKGSSIVLVGDQEAIHAFFKEKNVDSSEFSIVHSEDVIEMGEHPAKAFTSKPNSSIALGFKMLKTKEGDAFCSAGNTGAMLVGSMFTIKAIEGIIRPGIASFIPKEKGGYGLLLDAGANADCRPDVLAQFGLIGSMYAEHVMGIKNPKVGLMNLGEEEQKGTPTTQAAHQLLKLIKSINFVGNIEGRDCFNDKADVIVCDGFTGNVILKMAESFYDISIRKNMHNDFMELFNYEAIGGSPILGVNGNVIIGHGASTPKAIKNMILMAQKQVENQIHTKIKEFL